MFYNACEDHQDIFYDGTSNLFALVFPVNFLKNAFDDHLAPQEFLFKNCQPIVDDKIVTLSKELLFFRQDEVLSEAFLESTGLDLLYYLYARFSHSGTCQFEKLKKERGFPDKIKKSKEIIRETLLNEDFSLELLSKEIDSSKFHFIREFKNSTNGLSPMKFRNLLRIDRAAHELLKQPKKRIIDVAEDCGFGDLSSFNRLFLKFKGITPSQYREKIK